MNKTPYLLFDIGNVFLYANHDITYEYLVGEHKISPQKAKKFFTIPEYKQFAKGKISGDKFANTIRKLINKNDLNTKEIRRAHDMHITRVIDNSMLILQQLQKNNYEFGFITNTNVWQNAVEKKFVDFSSFADTIIRSNEVGMTKTEPAMFRLTIKRLGREDILFIDDDLANIKTAKSVGIESIQVKKNTPNLKRELEKTGITLA